MGDISESYEQNLKTLAFRLKATEAKLIWASTTTLKGRIDQGGSYGGRAPKGELMSAVHILELAPLAFEKNFVKQVCRPEQIAECRLK